MKHLLLSIALCASCLGQGILTLAGNGGSGVDVTAPTFVSGSAVGTTLTVNWSEPVSQGAGYDNADFNLDASTTGNDLGLTYATGNGTATWTFTIASAIVEGETLDLDFTRTADEVEDAAGNDLATIVSAAVSSTTPPAMTWQASSNANNDLTEYTFSTMAIGAEAARDNVVVGFFARATSNGLAVSTVTIGGVSATLIATHGGNDGSNSSVMAFYHAVVPTGTTADVVVTVSATALRASLDVWTVTDVASFTATDTGTRLSSSSNGVMTLTLDTPTGNSVVLALAQCVNGGVDWTGLTERSDRTLESTATLTAADGAFSSAAEQTITAAPVSASTSTQLGLSICLQ